MAFQDIISSFNNRRIKGHHRYAEDHSSKVDTTCLNCGTVFKGNYCPTCGQSGTTKKLTIGMAIDNILGVMANFDKGFVHTLAELVYRPGHMIRDYLEGHRVEYVRPIQLMFLLVTILLCIMFFLSVEVDSVLPISFEVQNVGKEKTQPFFDVANSILSNISFQMIALSILSTLPNFYCFKLTKYGKTLTLAENFYVMAYISCLLLMWRIPFMLVNKFVCGLEEIEIFMDQVLTLLTYKQLLRESVFRALGIYLLSTMLIVIAVALVFLVVYLMVDSSGFVNIKNMSIEYE